MYTIVQRFGIGKIFIFFYIFERSLLCSLDLLDQKYGETSNNITMYYYSY